MKLRSSPEFYIGTSNIELPVANKKAFPEAFQSASRLTYYASLFNSLEVNSSFYKIPLAKTVERWTTEVPDDFRFTFKLYQELTHNKAGGLEPELVKRYMTTINAAQRKAGCLLIQLPPSAAHNPAYIEHLLTLVQKDNNAWSVCVEFRHESWYRASVYRLLEKYGAAIVLHDMPRSAPPEIEPWTDFVYYRFHGLKGDYRGEYELHLLERYAEKIGSLRDEGKTVYTYFNNTIGNAVFDALVLQELVTGKSTFQP